MRQLTFLILFVFIQFCVVAQFSIGYDTLSIDDRMHGKLDSVDFYAGDLPTTFEFGQSIRSQSGLSSDKLIQSMVGGAQNYFSKYNQMQFSALPYLGFSYSFGGQGSQFLQAKYRQAFTDSLLLNIDYERRSATGYIRNSAFQANNVQLQLDRKGKRFSFQFKGMYENDSLMHSYGLVQGADSLIEMFDLDLIPVRRSASSNFMRGQVGLKTYLNFLNDSIRQFGLTTNHELKVYHRRYIEDDTLSNIYDTIFIDSNSTFDKFNWAQISNSGGVYWMNDQLLLDANVGIRYWNVLNLDNIFDTTELFLSSSLQWKVNNWRLNNDFYLNVVGRFNEWSNRLDFSYLGDSWFVSGGLRIENLAPNALQRSFAGNAYNYTNSFNKLQNIIAVNGKLEKSFLNSKLDVQLFANNTVLSNLLWFNDTTWVQVDNVMNVLQFGAQAETHVGAFHFNPVAKFSSDNYGYLPEFQGYLRSFVKGRLFEAKKMEAYLGVDLAYQSKFMVKRYNPIMNAYNWFEQNAWLPSSFNAHAFLGFQIETFRFYARFENIGYLWMNHQLEEIQNYPVAGTRFRVGITWDFFN